MYYNQRLKQDELMHYGVLGMKWGQRKYQNSDGALTADGRKRYGSDISIRKVKHVKRQFQSGIKSKKIDNTSLNDKVVKKLNKTKEAKNLNDANDVIKNIYKSAEKQGISRNQVVFGRDFAEAYNNTVDAYDKKMKEIAKSYVDEYASVTLKSLGYKDTKKSREWLKKQDFMEW